MSIYLAGLRFGVKECQLRGLGVSFDGNNKVIFGFDVVHFIHTVLNIYE